MIQAKSISNTPITFDVDLEIINQLRSLQEKLGIRYLSELIRFAIAEYDFSNHKGNRISQRQISVRLPLEIRDKLQKFSNRKKISLGELLRVAIMNLSENKPKPQNLLAMATMKKKSAAKKKPAAKKKSTSRKPAKKKSAAKKRPAAKKKATAKKRPAAKKKTAKKKPAAKKDQPQATGMMS